MVLTKRERNGLMESLLAGGLKASDCTLRELKEQLTAKLVPSYERTHEPTGSRFEFFRSVGGSSWQGVMRTGTDPRIQCRPGTGITSW